MLTFSKAAAVDPDHDGARACLGRCRPVDVHEEAVLVGDGRFEGGDVFDRLRKGDRVLGTGKLPAGGIVEALPLGDRLWLGKALGVTLEFLRKKKYVKKDKKS